VVLFKLLMERHRPFAIPLLLVLFGFALGVATTSLGARMTGSAIFRDIQPGSFYDESIGEMYEAGIIKGYESGKFGPQDYVTRGQLAVMFKRFRDSLEVGREEEEIEEEEEEAAEEETEEEEAATTPLPPPPPPTSAEAPAGKPEKPLAERNPRGTIRFTIKSFSVPESAPSAKISVVRGGGHEGTVTVEYTLSGGTALSEGDFTPVTGTLTFGPRETSKTFEIPIANDTTTEGNESLTVILRTPTGGADLGVPASALLTITDDETAGVSATPTAGLAQVPSHTISFNALSYSVSEDGGSIAITVRRDGGTSAVTVQYSTSNGTALAGTDYEATSGTLSFAVGETTKSFTVSVKDDTQIDGNTTVNLSLSNPTGGAALGKQSASILTIVDNETTKTATGSLKFGASSFRVTEGEGTAWITVSRVGGSTGTVSVNYATENGSAVAGQDYSTVTGTLTFLPGETGKAFAVPVRKDENRGEGEESLTVTLNNPTGGASLGNPSTVTLKISD